MEATLLTDIVRILIFVPLFFYASYTDWKYRKVEKSIWYAGVVIGPSLLVTDIIYGRFSMIEFVAGAIIVFIVLMIFWIAKFGLGDYKAIVTLFLIFPVFPSIASIPLFSPLPEIMAYGLRPFILVAVENTAVVAILYPFYNLMFNVYNKNNLGRDSFTVVKVSRDKLKNSHGWLVYGDKDYRAFIDDIRLLEEEWDNTTVDSILQFLDGNNKKVKVRTGIPFITVLTIGVVVTLILGISPVDLLYYTL